MRKVRKYPKIFHASLITIPLTKEGIFCLFVCFSFGLHQKFGCIVFGCREQISSNMNFCLKKNKKPSNYNWGEEVCLIMWPVIMHSTQTFSACYYINLYISMFSIKKKRNIAKNVGHSNMRHLKKQKQKNSLLKKKSPKNAFFFLQI